LGLPGEFRPVLNMFQSSHSIHAQLITSMLTV
jgi:hypothetical protein